MAACKCLPAPCLFGFGGQRGLRRVDAGDGGVDRARRQG